MMLVGGKVADRLWRRLNMSAIIPYSVHQHTRLRSVVGPGPRGKLTLIA